MAPASKSRARDDHDWAWLKPEDLAALHTMAISERLDGGLPQVKILPPESEPVKFIGEGAANAVFEIAVPRSGDDTQEFEGLLLRVAKVPSLGQSLAYDYLKQQKHFHTSIQPLLGEYAVHQELVVLRGSGIVGKLNALLQERQQHRQKKFKDSYVGESDWGFLVEDMQPVGPSSSIMIEFKPKWLLQSPSAPKDAVRCRQCAVNLHSFLTHPPSSGNKSPPYQQLCPLSFMPGAHELSNDPFRVAPQLAQDEQQRGHYAECIRNVTQHRAIEVLRGHQAQLDNVGPLTVVPSDTKFPLAMTLRDCTCFAHIPLPKAGCSRQPLKLKFGDLDWKDPAVKMERWRSAEASLIDGGFYSALSVQLGGDGRNVYTAPTGCALEYATNRADKSALLRVLGSGEAVEPRMSVNMAGIKAYDHVTTRPDLLRPALERWQDMTVLEGGKSC